MHEIKYRVPASAPDALRRAGFQFIETHDVVDTYVFSAPGSVLKLHEKEGGYHVIALEREQEGFALLEKRAVNAAEMRTFLDTHEVEMILRKRVHAWKRGSFRCGVHDIPGVGHFAVFTGGTPTPELLQDMRVAHTLQIPFHKVAVESEVYGLYTHYKGGVYDLLHIGLDEVTKERVCVYCAVDDGAYPRGQIWVRRADIFFSDVQGTARFTRLSQ